MYRRLGFLFVLSAVFVLGRFAPAPGGTADAAETSADLAAVSTAAALRRYSRISMRGLSEARRARGAQPPGERLPRSFFSISSHAISIAATHVPLRAIRLRLRHIARPWRVALTAA